MVRARVGQRDDTWRPAPRTDGDPGGQGPPDRFSSSGRHVPKYVPGIEELRTATPPPRDDEDGPPASGPTARSAPAAPAPAPGAADPVIDLRTPPPAPPGPPPAPAPRSTPAAPRPSSPPRPAGPEAAAPATSPTAVEVAPPAVASPAAVEVAPPPAVDLTEPTPAPDADLAIEAETIRLEFEPEDEQVDQILQALVARAKDRRVAIADVAVELVEQAELEDRDIDDVLADLVEHTERGGREELVLYNDEVPSRPGRLVDLDSLGVEEKKRIIVRVLCELVALHESANASADPSLVPAEATDADGADGAEDETATEEPDPETETTTEVGPEAAETPEGEASAPDSAGGAGAGSPSNGLEWPEALDEAGDDNGGPAGPDDLPDRRLLRGWHT